MCVIFVLCGSNIVIRICRLYLVVHESSRVASRPGPGGMTNVHPSSRPGKLPRVRRGMYRPASIISHADTLSGSASGTTRSTHVFF